MADSSLRISGMHCAACAGIIEQAVSKVGGVIDVQVSAAGERARIHWNPARASMTDIVAAIANAGYGALPDAAMEAREARRQEHRAALWRLFVAAFCAMQVMMMATPSYVAHGDELAMDMRQLLNWGSWLLTLPVLAFSAGPFFRGAWHALRQRRIGMDVPVSLGIAVTFVASSGATFDPAGPFGHEVYFDSLTMFVSFLLAGRWLEVRARHRVAQVLESTLNGMPESANRVLDDGSTETVSVQRLAVGDRVRVAVGQAFPADGELIEGQTSADEALLTGESRPVSKVEGAPVVAGSINLGAPVTMRVARTGQDTRLQAIVAMMRDAMTQRPALARAADRWAGPFLWTVLLLASGAAAVWSVVDPSRAVWVAVSVLIVTCPCALSLAVPAALLSASSALARRGVLLQRLDALEAWSKIDRVYFDKTGTVTDDSLHWRGLIRHGAGAGARSDAELMHMASSLAAWSTHPMSRAVAAQALPGAPFDWRDVQEHAGLGLSGLDAAGKLWRLGSAGFVGVTSAATDLGGAAVVWFGCDHNDVAGLCFDESVRPDAAEAIAGLRARGIEVLLLSGDRADRAARMATQLAVDGVIGDATPEIKLAEIESAQAKGLRVAMVGDGINDAPVLARADVSLAMGQGALVARAHADAVVASNRLGDLVKMHDLSRRTMRVVRQNLVWAAGYNLVCIPLALVGWLPPWAAGLGMASSSVLVILNAMRLAR
ncbi:cation-translocating P-type ATPase [Ideonella sp. A 288]|uniref:heavy metal translocating P-type ATPase n=1 Tax=Ideonella sp. A 288 TaxID=1962181 RepID=UPI001F2B41FB|nr:cation-translocating P-type ATPase [Ideonella sp. A 288]